MRNDLGAVLFVCARPLSDPAVEAVSRELGQVLVRAASAAEALALARATDFALILAGYAGDLGALGAVITALRANARSSQTPIVALGLPDEPGFALEPLYEAGATAVLHEPLSPTILKAKARFYLQAFTTAAERRRAEEALEDTRARLESIIAAAEVGVWSWEVAPDVVTADASMAALFGLSAADAAGSPLGSWFAAIHPDDVQGTQALLERATRTGAPYDATFRIRAPAARWRWVIARGQVALDVDGKPVRLRGVGICATRQMQAEEQLRASEERYRTLFDSLDDGVCVIEVRFDQAGIPRDFCFLETNPAFVTQTGLREVEGRCARDLHPELEEHWYEMLGRVARTGEPVRFTNEARSLGRWYDVYATRTGEPELHRVAILFNDITERRRAEEELRRLAADLAEADRLKNAFRATLAHELRNPLAPIRSGLQYMRRAGAGAGADPAALARVQDIMDRQLDHLVHLVDDLLDVARITRGQVELKCGWIDLADVIASAVDASMPLVEAARHRLDLRLPPAPVRLWADPIRLTQVVSNLLNNAAKYTPRGGAIVVAAERDGDEVVIAIADNGIGIAQEALPEVFKMFARVGTGMHGAHGGLGIGLSLVRSLVELHGGSVSAASEGANAGSVFTVRLPLNAADVPASQPPVPTLPGTPDCVPLRVLVVDDNRDAAETLAALLDVMGHTAPVANDGHQALRMIQSFRPQVVFLDLGMPGMSGYEVAQEIRRNPDHHAIKLVALTGWGGAQDRARSASAGFDLHLTKPATIAAIEQVLARL